MDNVTLLSLVCWLKREWPRVGIHGDIWYFTEVSVAARWTLKLLALLGYAHLRTRPAEYIWGHLRSDDGDAIWHQVAIRDLTRICARVRERELQSSVFLRQLVSRYFDRKRLMLYMEKRVYAEMMDEVIPINVVAHQFAEGRGKLARPCLVLGNSRWKAYLLEYCEEKEVDLVFYPCLARGRRQDFLRTAYFTLTRIPHMLSGGLQHIYQRARGRMRQATLLTISHTGWAINGDRGGRHDLFWWLQTQIAPEKVMIYCTRPDLPLTENDLSFLEEIGIRFIAIYPGAIRGTKAPLWRTTGTFYVVSAKLCCVVWWALLCGVVADRGRAFSYIRYVNALLFDFAFWYDFFKTQGVRANVNYGEFSGYDGIGCTMALRHLGGVNISYQGSNLYDASVEITPSSDIIFSYSPLFASFWNSLRSPSEHFVYTGYIFDGVFKEVAARAKTQREELQAKGVEFILAYFDETSSHSRDAIITNEDASSVYGLLLQKLLDDETLGLVFKPKKSRDLFRRIADVMPLLEEAKATGRLLVLENSNVFPAEAALIADMTIGELVGTTAALEAYLAGTPSVLVDTLDMRSHPYYDWGEGTVVFADWAAAFAAIAAYRTDQETVLDLGDWSPMVDRLDSYRDGRAGLRVGAYMASLVDNISEGRTREDAIRLANEEFIRCWGVDAVETRVVVS